MVTTFFKAIVAFLLQSLLVLASSGASELPLEYSLRWLARYAHVQLIRHGLDLLLAHPAWLATGVWCAAQLSLVVYTVRSLRHGRIELAWGELVTPLIIVAFAVCAVLITAGMATFVSNTSRVFLSERVSLWAGLGAAGLLAVYLARIAWAEIPRKPVWRHR